MQLDTVRTLFEQPGPFISLHLDVSRDTEDARQQLTTRWTNVRHELEKQGVTDPVVEELGERLTEQTGLQGQVRRTLVAGGDRVLHDEALAGETTWPETIEVGPLPDLAGWLSMADGQIPFLLVEIDRVGADLSAYTAPRRHPAEQNTVTGGTYPITKVHESRYKQDIIQQRAENQWEFNAREVADEVVSLAKQYRPRLVILAGDIRARTALAEELDGPSGAQVEQVSSGGRAEGTSDESLWEDINRLLATYEGDQVDALVQELERGAAVSEGVLTGPDRVADGMVKGSVQRLVLELEEARDVLIDPADHPGLVLPQAALEAGRLPADQVLVAAAALTAAEVSVLPAGIPMPSDFALSSGVAATLRWDERRQ